jgi:hypothetical protein
VQKMDQSQEDPGSRSHPSGGENAEAPRRLKTNTGKGSLTRLIKAFFQKTQWAARPPVIDRLR